MVTYRRFRANRYDVFASGVEVGYFTSYGHGAFKLFLSDGTLVGIIEQRGTRQEAAARVAQAAHQN